MSDYLTKTPTQCVYSELQHAYDHFNRLLFEGGLPQCVITLQREKATAGYFSPTRFSRIGGHHVHEIALNPIFFGTLPVVETLQTMVHEMVHLYQAEFGKPGRGGYHNSEFADKMESIGLMPSSTGKPRGARTGDKMADYPMLGGRFLAACRELLSDAFQVTWFDRFPPNGHTPSTEHALEIVERLRGELPLTALVAPIGALMKASPSAPRLGVVEAGAGEGLLDLQAVDDWLGEISTAHDQSTAVDASSPADSSKPGSSNRIKYTCACEINVWGKPHLRLQCLECLQRFRPQVQKSRGGQVFMANAS